MKLIEEETIKTYNARVYNYPLGTQVTLYNNPIAINTINENCKKSYINAVRTEEEEKHSLAVSLGRTKNNIYQISRSNVWKWFITLTFDRQKTDSSNYDEVTKKLQNYLDNLKRRYCPNLKYLIVPELHADKTHYHFHGLLADCDELGFVFSGKFDKDSKKAIFNVPSWKYGYTTATIVEDSQKASSYITKYITKDTIHFLKEKNRYYTNRNTKKVQAEKVNINHIGFIEDNANAITYIKDTTVKDAHRGIKYIETNNKEQINKYIEENKINLNDNPNRKKRIKRIEKATETKIPNQFIQQKLDF